MPENFTDLNQEQLKAENDFLKMKMMLEQGAHFFEGGNIDIPPEIENKFLNNVLVLEKQFAERKVMMIFDKIGRPEQFKPAYDIPDHEIDKAWNELRDYLSTHAIVLDACSPYITSRELYRFVVEELFKYEMEDISLPGWTTHFIYDEFHPDPVYESEQLIRQNLFPVIFGSRAVDEYFHCFVECDILINGKLYPTNEEVKVAISHFKSLFLKIKLRHLAIEFCEVVNETKTVVTGKYKAVGISGNDGKVLFGGKFTIELVTDSLGYWSVKTMEIDGLSF